MITNGRPFNPKIRLNRPGYSASVDELSCGSSQTSYIHVVDRREDVAELAAFVSDVVSDRAWFNRV